MNRDPTNFECTRDPIFLFQVGIRQWTQIPAGLESDGDAMRRTEGEFVEPWISPFVEVGGHIAQTPEFFAEAERHENDHGWPYIYVEWRTESVFLRRVEAEEYGRKHTHRWQAWKVYCIPCDGELATILNDHEPLPAF